MLLQIFCILSPFFEEARHEFGAFVDKDSTWESVKRSPFHCDVIDKKMDELAGLFIANAPLIPVKCDFEKDDKKEGNAKEPLVTLHKWDTQGRDFAIYLRKALEDEHPLNYVVVATENFHRCTYPSHGHPL